MPKTEIVVVGLGYVGLPLAVAFARNFTVTGLDTDEIRIDELLRHYDRTGEVDDFTLACSTVKFTSCSASCEGADFYIVTVPTPIDGANQPDLTALIEATRAVAKMLDGGRQPVVVYESTVYPGVTEEICGPLLEHVSGLVCGKDFYLGYSPERINPGDRQHTVDRIVKVVSGQTTQVTERLAQVYGTVTSAGVYVAASIKVAEAAKVIENAQRDINIAFMNEIAQIFAKLDLSVWDVIEAAATKWNFLPFEPGLVGGHCISVDPYYLSYRAQQLGHDPDVILAGRSINDGMGRWVADSLHKHRGCAPGAVLILGMTFKQDVPDLRNSRVIDIVHRLRNLGHDVIVHDPRAHPKEALQVYGVELNPQALDDSYDLVLAAVPHVEYRDMLPNEITSLLRTGGSVADLKGIWRDLDFGPEFKRWTL